MESLICTECGATESLKNWQESYSKELIDKQCCHSCEYWLARTTPSETQIVVESTCYQIAKTPTANQKHKGHSGRVFKIQKDDGQIIETDNLWYNGVIPDRFRIRIPNNAKFI